MTDLRDNHATGSALVFRLEPDLIRDLDGDQAATAQREGVATTLQIDVGEWQSMRELLPPPPALGLLILDGTLEWDALIAGVGCAGLLAPGDLMPAYEEHDGLPSLPVDARWRALTPATVAVLDEAFAARVLARWPIVGSRLVGRAARVIRSLATHFAITCMIGLEARLYALLWHLADRFGRVERAGVVVPLRLTHETLGRLVRARRPSVSAALARLVEQRLIERCADRTWLLHGDPPNQLPQLGKRAALDARNTRSDAAAEPDSTLGHSAHR